MTLLKNCLMVEELECLMLPKVYTKLIKRLSGHENFLDHKQEGINSVCVRVRVREREKI